MYELFAMSSGRYYTAQKYLPVFADKARDNMSGWGIGFFLGTARSTPSFPGCSKNLRCEG